MRTREGDARVEQLQPARELVELVQLRVRALLHQHVELGAQLLLGALLRCQRLGRLVVRLAGGGQAAGPGAVRRGSL